LIAFTTSCSLTGPTCWPPIAMYHWASAMGLLPSFCARAPYRAGS
jgi:hypothetical protein